MHTKGARYYWKDSSVCVCVYLIEINHRKDQCLHVSCLTGREIKLSFTVKPNSDNKYNRCTASPENSSLRARRL